MHKLVIITGIVITLFLGTVSSAICSTTEYTEVVTLNQSFTTQANWMHEIPDLFQVDTASIRIVGSAAEFGSDIFKLWLHFTDDAAGSFSLGEDPEFLTVRYYSNFDFILITETLNDTQIGWLNGDGDIWMHMLTLNEFDQLVPGRFNFEVNASSLTVEGALVPIPAAVWLLGSGLVGLVGLRRKFRI